MSIAGTWQFRTGDDVAWAEPHYDDSDWATLQVPLDWGRQGFDDYSGIAWYRLTLRLRLGSHTAAAASDIMGRLAVTLGKIHSSYELYAGGERMGGVGALPPAPRVVYDRHGTYEIPRRAIDSEGRLVLGLRVWRSPAVTRRWEGGPFEGPFLLGTSRQLAHSELLAARSPLVLTVLYLLAGFYHLYLFRRRRDLKEALWFGLMSIGIGIYAFTRSQWKYDITDDFVMLKKIEYATVYMLPVFTIEFVLRLLSLRGRRSIRLYQGVFIALALLVAVIPGISINIHTLRIWQVMLLPLTVIFPAVVGWHAFKGQPEARTLFGGFVVFGLMILNDLGVDNRVWVGPRLTAIGFAVFVLSMAGSLAARYARLFGELKVLSADLSSKNRRLFNLDKLKDEFLANTSHELRTPLNGIVGLADSLIDGVSGKLPGKATEHLGMIVSSGRRLSRLVDDLLDFSKLKSRDFNLQLGPVDMHALTDVVLTLSLPLLVGKELRLVNEVPPGAPLVQADENRVQQIMHNLVGNAIKFTPRGRISVSCLAADEAPGGGEITGTIAAAAGHLTIVVSDTGIGIPEDQLDSVFESFEQLDGTSERAQGGTGIGLAITRELVELHGGTIGAESEPARGSRFSFTLPLSDDTRPVESTAPGPREVTLGPAPPGPLGDSQDASSTLVVVGARRRILVVDDDPVNRQVLVNYLELRDFSVTEAHDGFEALELIRNGEPYAAVVLDVMMPGLSGYEVCRSIRRKIPSTQLAIILLTAKDRPQDLVTGLQVGANDYLTQPFSKDVLLARLDAHLRLQESHRLLEEYNQTLEEKVEERTADLRTAQKQLVESAKMASLGTLVAGVAHEVNTPVGVGVTAASLIVQETRELAETYQAGAITKSRLERYLDRMHQTGDVILTNLQRTSDLVKSFKQVSVDQTTESRREFELKEYLESVLRSLSPQFGSRDVAITVECPGDLSITSYPGAFAQIVTNLVMNSLDHGFEGSRSGRITVSARTEGDRLIVSYTDDGRGIEAEVLPRIFDPFFTTSLQRGSGLGLNIVYNLVTHRLGGSIECSSESGAGVLFTITLPLTTGESNDAG